MILSPIEIGLPEPFTEWRAGQGEAIEQMVDAFQAHNIVVLCQPVGSGKTINYIGLALMMGWRVLVVTSTKALQDQLLRDFRSIGMVDIRGRANYQCSEGANVTCEEGAHMRCSAMRTEHCGYWRDYQEALKAQLVTTNYSYYMLIYLYSEGLGKFDLVVFDEAHDAPPEVCAVMGQTITARQVDWMLNAQWPDNPLNPDEWRAWARCMYPRAALKLEQLENEVKGETFVQTNVAMEIRRWKELVKALLVLMEAEGPWAAERVWLSGGGMAYRVEPLWPAQYARRVLLRDHERILMVSATVRAKTMELLGLERHQYMFFETPWMFPQNRSPIYFIPTARVQYDSTPDDWALIQQRIDEIMDPRQDRNAVIHAVSYDKAQWLMEHCLYNHTFISHERNSQATRDAIAQFERMQFTPPAVLVSPSVATGNDFAYRKAEYQIVVKVPFVVVKGSPIMEARCNGKRGGDKTYGEYLMAQTLSQMFGRIMRAPDDRGETFVIDSNFGRVINRLRHFFPPWVHLLIRRTGRVPAPPPALAIERGR